MPRTFPAAPDRADRVVQPPHADAHVPLHPAHQRLGRGVSYVADTNLAPSWPAVSAT